VNESQTQMKKNILQKENTFDSSHTLETGLQDVLRQDALLPVPL